MAVLGDFAAMPDDIILMYRQRFNSANYRLRKSPLRPNFKAIDVIYSHPEIRRRFTSGDLQRRRRLAEIDVFWVGARNEYVHGRMIDFLAYSTSACFGIPTASCGHVWFICFFVRCSSKSDARPAAAPVRRLGDC